MKSVLKALRNIVLGNYCNRHDSLRKPTPQVHAELHVCSELKRSVKTKFTIRTHFVRKPVLVL
eukprot:2979340-Amphidinium_carterae.1